MTSSAISLAQELVAIPSTPVHDQRDVAMMLRDRLAASGFQTSVQEYGERTCNVVAVYGDPKQSTLCFSGHLDTVPVVAQDWEHDPHGAEIAGDRLWGRGSSDMKAGVAAIVDAAERYAREAARDAPPVSLVLTGGEELGCLGATALAEESGRLPSAHALVIAEPTSNQPLIGHRGAVWVDVLAKGISCHGSTPELGDNAIDSLTEALGNIRRWHQDNPSTHDVLGVRTLSTGTISGGVQRNVVPDHAHAELDFRTGRTDDWQTLASNLRRQLSDNAELAERVSVPPVYTDPAEAFVATATALAQGVRPDPPVAQFITDASVLTPALGEVPTVIWGPGSADQAHVVDESCATEEISTAADMYVDLLWSYAQDPTFAAAHR